MPIRAVVFDLFDTLVDLRWEQIPPLQHNGARLPASTRALHAEVARHSDVDFDAFGAVLRERLLGFRESHFSRGVEVPTQQVFTEVLERFSLDTVELVERLTEIHMGTIRGAVAALPHHPGLLGELRRRTRLGLCSNFSHSPTAIAVLEQAELHDHLDAVVISDAFGLRKPRREIFEEVLARLGVEAHEAIHVGDSLQADVAGAAAVGIRTAWVTRRVHVPERVLREHEGSPPDHTFKDLAELPRLLDALESSQ